MKFTLPLVFISFLTIAQVSQRSITETLKPGAPLPEKLLSTRTAVLYDAAFTTKEINDIHAGMIRAGVDAVAYFETDRVFAGADVEAAFSQYFTNREINSLVFAEKKGGLYRLTITTFNNKPTFIDPGQGAWIASDAYLKETLRVLYSTALGSYKKQNLLISETPEMRLQINVITARRTEAFATDLKVDRLAVQKFGDERDAELEDIMKLYPFKYTLVDASVPEPELRKQGMFYMLRFVYSRGPVAKQLLGYEVRHGETALVSVTYPGNTEQLKTIPAETPIYKFYNRQIEFNNVFLGTKWDADVTWQQALRNFIVGFKRELRIE
ncbi:MAG: hypothetical protein KF845_02125 [Cyclobacteriaceae bacterium]|nr:hypothetical protein [Cyclobacteriaceae bacterium]